MKIGILQTGHVLPELADEHGDYISMFSQFLDGYGFEFEGYAVVDGIFPASVSACDGWIITGSRHGAYEKHAWIPPLEELIRKIYAQKIPIVGICFGHQIMAQALGGKVEKFGGVWGVGINDYVHRDGSTTSLLAMHQDQVVEIPKEATIEASSDICKVAMLSYKGPALSIQPHPEFSPEFVRKLITMQAGTAISPDQAIPALRSLDRPYDSKHYSGMIAKFFHDAHSGKAV